MQQDNSEQVIIDPRLIARHYIRTWFFLDLISSIPLDYVFLIFNSLTGNGVSNKCETIITWNNINDRNHIRRSNLVNIFQCHFLHFLQDYPESFQILHAGRALRILRLAKLLSLVRLLRLSRLVRYVSQWEEVYVSKTVHIYVISIEIKYFPNKNGYPNASYIWSISIKI